MIWSPQTVQKRQRKCFIYFPRFLPTLFSLDLILGQVHINLTNSCFLFKWHVMPLCCKYSFRSGTCHRKKSNWKLDLEKITSTTDYELSQVNRRTITENGVTQVVCEIGQVPIWSSNLKLLPIMLCLYAVDIPLDREPANGRNLLEYPW
jgi:hypothetical protein